MTFLATWGCASCATKIQKWPSSKKFVGAKTLKLKVRNYSNFTITFSTIWRCAGDFFKDLLKFNMAATDQRKKLVWSFFLF